MNLDLAKRLSARASKTRAVANKAANMATAAEKIEQQRKLNDSANILMARYVRTCKGNAASAPVYR